MPILVDEDVRDAARALSDADLAGFRRQWLDYQRAGGDMAFDAWLVTLTQMAAETADAQAWCHEHHAYITEAPQYQTIQSLRRTLKIPE